MICESLLLSAAMQAKVDSDVLELGSSKPEAETLPKAQGSCIGPAQHLRYCGRCLGCQVSLGLSTAVLASLRHRVHRDHSRDQWQSPAYFKVQLSYVALQCAHVHRWS
jgi:hypothetical protein